MRIRTILALLLLLAIFGMSFVAAQEESPPLRDLAEANDIYIGSVAWTQHLSNPRLAEVLGSEFNMFVHEHQAKFCMIQQQRGVFNFTDVDTLMDFAAENNMVVRGHTLIWHSCEPAWLSEGDFSRDEAIEIMRDHIYTVVGRYKGRIPIWDVVNEAIDGGTYRNTPLLRMIGEDYIELAFQFAHEADPDALLFYNDYGAEGLNAKSQAIYDMVSDFVARGVPIHGVGLQMHLQVGETEEGNWLAQENLRANMQRIADLGLQVQVTEMDVRHGGTANERIYQRQAADYRRVLEVCLDLEACTAFIVWGVSDNLSWIRGWDGGNPQAEPLLFNSNFEPKLAYFAVADLLARRAGLEPILSDEEVDAFMGTGEDTTTAALPEPTRSNPAQLAPDPVAGVVYYAPFSVSITLDGDTSDWENIPRVTVDNGPALPANSDTSFSFAVAADETSLYFLAEVQDSQLVYGLNEPVSAWYLEDSVEFYLNTTGNLEATAYESGIAQIGILAANITGSEPPILGGSNSGDSHISVFAMETETGYLIEAAVPLETDAWSIQPRHRATLGFQAHLNSSSGEGRDTKLIWSSNDPDDQSWTNPSRFGQLVLWYKDF
jgi:GH35 family endo-1,4-beta-xylanase